MGEEAAPEAGTGVCPCCGHLLTKVGPFRVCPEHGQLVGEPRFSPLRIFLSYGRDANASLVQRIKSDLQARGHDVWFDRDEIKAGHDWRRSITDGISASDSVLSFLSRHSTRDPGVCLDEIAIAIGVKGGNIQTILVESEQEVRPPASVSHVQWLDMHDWKVRLAAGDPAWEEWYEAKLAEILRVVESDDSRRFAGEIELLKEILSPISSDSRIAQLLKNGFVGRTWLVDAVEKWRLSADRSSRLFSLFGAPGVGKSAFAAHLAHYGRDKILAVQFCEYDKPDHRDAGRLVTSLAFGLATRLPDYRKLLLALPEIRRLEGKSPPELFDYLLAEPLSNVIEGERDRQLIVIDGLDEAGEGRKNVLVDMLAANAQRLPAWIGIVATSRPESSVVAPLQGLNPMTFDTSTELNRDDIRTFLRSELASQLEGRSDAERLLDGIVSKSEGVFLYVERLCAEVQAGNLSLDDPSGFPRGLGGTYFQYLRRQFPDIQVFRRDIRPAMRAILAAREPLPVGVLQRLFAWSDEEVSDFVRWLGPLFLVSSEVGRSGGPARKALRPTHKSLADFVSDEAQAAEYFVSRSEGHRMLAAFGLAGFHHGQNLDPYYSDQLVGHLAGSHDWETLNTMAQDDGFLRLITGSSAMVDIPAALLAAPSGVEVEHLRRVPDRYLEMCSALQLSEQLGLHDGRLPPVEAISTSVRPGRGMWTRSEFVACLEELLVWYSRALVIALRITSIRAVSFNDVTRSASSGWDIARLMNVLGNSEDLNRLTSQILESEYPSASPALASLSYGAQRARSDCLELIRLTTERDAAWANRRWRFDATASDFEESIQDHLNSVAATPRWHPRKAELVKNLGPMEDYCEVHAFPCCDLTLVVDTSPSQFRADGCEDAPESN